MTNNKKGAKMELFPRLSSKKSCRLIAALLLIGLFVACTEVHVAVDTCPSGMGPRTTGGTEPDPGACTPGQSGGAAGKSATGFYGIGGTNPVPASPARTCTWGTLCASPGAACDPLYPTKKCKNTYWYSDGHCGCTCQY